MENVAEALKIAGFTILFVTALSIAMITIMQGKRTSETIINYSDKTKYYSDIQIENDNSTSRDRIVELKDIIPTLYRYDQEQYIVLFQDSNGKNLKILDDYDNVQTKCKKIYSKDVSYLNYNLEAKLEEDWSRNHSTIKEHVGKVVKYLFSKGGKFTEKISITKNIYESNEQIEMEQQIQPDEKEIRVITYIQQ